MACFSSIFVVFLLSVALSYSVKLVDVDTICKQTTNPSFCSTLLNSKPGASRDLVSLAQYTIDVNRVNTTNTIALINKLLAQSGGNEDARYHYQACLDHFHEIVDLLEVDQVKLKRKEYDSVHQDAIAIRVHVGNCLHGDAPNDPRYHDTSLLPKYVNIVDQVAQILATISNYLEQA